MTLPVNEMFETIQGEGSRCGQPSIFIRLQGCPVGCPWCDTKYTWVQRADREVDVGEILTKDHDGSETWAAMDTETLLALVERCRAQHIVLTGGEPAMFDLTEVTAALHERERSTQIETSGTFPIRVDARTWVTLSPKLNMPGGLTVRDDALARADEIKMPIGKTADIAALQDLLKRGAHRPDALVYLQPLSLSRSAMDVCVVNATANNWRVSMQVHRLAGWR